MSRTTGDHNALISMINTTIVLLCPLILQQGIIKWDLKKVGGGGEGAGGNLSHSQVVSSGAERSSSRLISIIINVFRNI